MSRYKITSMEKVAPPQNVTSKNWYKFIIENEFNTIINIRSGSQKEILQFSRESIKRLNEKYLTHINFKMHRPVNEICSTSYHLI